MQVPGERDGVSDRSATEETRAKVKALFGEWENTQQKHEEEMQKVDAEVAKADRTGWFNRTGWPEHLARSNRKYLAHAIRLPDKAEWRLQRAVKVVDLLVERSVAGLSTLARETRRWLRSAKREEIDQRPMARLQNPESQARYAGYWKQFMCYCLHLVAAEEEVGEHEGEMDDERSEVDESDKDNESDESDEDIRGNDEDGGIGSY